MNRSHGKRYCTVTAFALAIIVAATRAQSTVIFFDDRSQFEASYPGLAVEDFQASGLAFGEVSGCNGPVLRGRDSLCYPPDALLSRIEVSDTSGLPGGVSVKAGDAPTGLLSTFVIKEGISSDSLVLNFRGGVFAVGFDLLRSIAGSETWTIRVLAANASTLAETTADVSPVGTFLGMSSDQPIFRIEISSSIDEEGVDNVTFDPTPIFVGDFETGTAVAWTCPDDDGDGFLSCTTDCDDSIAAFPGPFEFCYDGIDNDCDGSTDDCCSPFGGCPSQAHSCVLFLPYGHTECVLPSDSLQQGEPCQFSNSCSHGLGCHLPDSIINPTELSCATYCDPGHPNNHCDSRVGPGFECAPIVQLGLGLLQPDTVGVCIPLDGFCNDGICSTWESETSCPVDCV